MAKIVARRSSSAIFIGVFAVIGIIFLASSFALNADTSAPSTPKNFRWLNGCTQGSGFGTDSDTTDQQISLAWDAATDNVGVDHYDVYMDGGLRGSAAATSSPKYVDKNSPTNKAPGDLWPSSTHTYYIEAVDVAGNKSPDAIAIDNPCTATAETGAVIITAHTDADPSAPTAPTGVAATFHHTVSQPITVDLTWNASTDDFYVDHYDIYRDLHVIGHVSASLPLKFTDTTNTHSEADSKVLSENTTVKYLVQAVDEVKQSSISSNQVTIITDTAPPTMPSNLEVITVSDSSVSLGGHYTTLDGIQHTGWRPATDNFGVTGYNIYRNGKLITTQSYANGTTYYDSGLTPCVSYNYQVSAVDANSNESVKSNVVSAKTTGTCDKTPPVAPTNLAAAAKSAKQVDLSWTAATDNVGVTQYYIYRNNVLLARLGAVTSYSDTTTQGKSQYSYYVVAYDSAKNASPNSSPANVTTPSPADPTPPSAPQNLTLTAVSDGQINLTWGAASDNVGVVGYAIYRNGTLLTKVSAPATSFGNTGLPAAKQYKYYVKAYDASDNFSVASATQTISTPATTRQSHIQGFVTDNATSKGIKANVVITLNGSKHYFPTDSTGYYDVSYGINGTYNVVYTATNYAMQTWQISISTGLWLREPNVKLIHQ